LSKAIKNTKITATNNTKRTSGNTNDITRAEDITPNTHNILNNSYFTTYKGMEEFGESIIGTTNEADLELHNKMKIDGSTNLNQRESIYQS
jgi:hypothetical protein